MRQSAPEKHKWRKEEKEFYLPKNKPGIINIPEFKFLTLNGEGNPNSPFFSECIGILFSVSYAIKMSLKKLTEKPDLYCDYTVYPLEGVWDIKKEARKSFNGTINKNDLVFTLMIRQPDFVDDSFYNEILGSVKQKKPHPLLDELKFEKLTEGKCIQMLHTGSYDDEPASFNLMEEFAKNENLARLSKMHREIYLSDFRKTAPDKLKTVLRFTVEN